MTCVQCGMPTLPHLDFRLRNAYCPKCLADMAHLNLATQPEAQRLIDLAKQKPS